MDNILENNKLIAEFMGFYEAFPGNSWLTNFDRKQDLCVEDTKYDSSWDWLMPVIERIESLGYWVETRNTFIAIGKKDHENSFINLSFSSLRNTRLQVAYTGAVAFINWHNDDKK